MPILVKQLPLFGARSKKRRRAASKPGPKPRAERLGFVPHRTRPLHAERHPVHVSIKRVRLAPSLRSERVFDAILAQIRVALARGIRVVHWTVQDDHIHLIAEADDKAKLARALKFLFSRIAMAVNAVARRYGALFRDRHHRRDLFTPRQTRNALAYVLFNTRKHAAQHGSSGTDDYDPWSSLVWFDGFGMDTGRAVGPDPTIIAACRARAGPSPVAPATTWLATSGWRRAGGPLPWNFIPG